MRSLVSITLFAGLATQARTSIERRCKWHTHAAGELILNHGDTSNDIYFLTEGSARVVIYAADGKAVAFRNIEQGNLLGEMAAIDGRPRSASIEARTACTLASLTSEQFRTLLREEPIVMERMLIHFIDQIRSLTDRVFEFSTLAASNRIQAELLRLVRQSKHANGAAVLAPPPRQSEIAERISTQREAVAREFTRLTKLGLIERQGSTLVVKDVARLARMIEQASQQ